MRLNFSRVSTCVALAVWIFILYRSSRESCFSEYDVTPVGPIEEHLANSRGKENEMRKAYRIISQKFERLQRENKFLRRQLVTKTKDRSLLEGAEEVALAVEEDTLLMDGPPSFSSLPSVKEETMKRRIYEDAVELLYSMQAHYKGKKGEEILPLSHLIGMRRDISFENLVSQHTAMMIDIEKLMSLNEEWKAKEAEQLQILVQKRIHFSQNPSSCSEARKLICYLVKPCGFGCQLHHLTYCLMVAFGTNRTMILVSKDWSYSPKGWETVFRPLSNTCQKRNKIILRKWTESTNHELEVALPPVDSLLRPPTFVPLAIPVDIAPRLKRLHGNPGVWWTAQFVKYLMRGQEWLEAELQLYENRVGFNEPIVGVQVRRTDKIGAEAQFHPLREYMGHVNAWYDKYVMKNNLEEKVKRRVYLATDDPQVVEEAKEKFSNYEFVNFVEFSRSAYKLKLRTTMESLKGVVVDVHMLSRCNYIVCTFSSQVCRVAYELMQTRRPDASADYRSLDDIFYFGGQTAHEQLAIYDHKPRPRSEEIELRIGDVIIVEGNHWDGLSKGKNTRTEKVGLYPSWKVKDLIKEVKYPTYPQATRIAKKDLG